MAMTNEEIISAVKEGMTGAEASLLSEATTGIDVLNISQTYPNVLNSFINTLTNKVTKSLIYSKIFTNPLKQLKKGALEYGDSIEELFVQMAMAKNFGENWEGSSTPEGDLIRKLKPKVTAMYIKLNMDKKYKTTVMDKQLRKAFLNNNGLSNLVMQIVGSITSQAEYQEFMYTKKNMNLLVETAENWEIDADHATESKGTIPIGTVIKQTPYIVNSTDTKQMVKNIRETTGFMMFPSTKFNLAKELNWCDPSSLMLMTTPDVIADLDVNVLASAFNVSMADLQTRTILVDEMPTGIFKKSDEELVDKTPTALSSGNTVVKDDTKKPKAILFDKDLLQIWDTYQGAGTFYNPEGEYTNHFANREGIFAICTFANMAIFY